MPKTKPNPAPKTHPGIQTRWDSTCEKIKSGETKLVFGFSISSIDTLQAIEAKSEGSYYPYGWVWYRHQTGRTISIEMSFVCDHVRRCGIRTAMHNQLLEWYPDTRMIVTGRATEFSKPWLEKMGFKFNKDFDRWELLVAPKKKPKK